MYSHFSIRAGYESVKKWTNKFDIFQKKYIIVPINERWVFVLDGEPFNNFPDFTGTSLLYMNPNTSCRHPFRSTHRNARLETQHSRRLQRVKHPPSRRHPTVLLKMNGSFGKSKERSLLTMTTRPSLVKTLRRTNRQTATPMTRHAVLNRHPRI